MLYSVYSNRRTLQKFGWYMWINKYSKILVRCLLRKLWIMPINLAFFRKAYPKHVLTLKLPSQWLLLTHSHTASHDSNTDVNVTN